MFFGSMSIVGVEQKNKNLKNVRQSRLCLTFFLHIEFMGELLRHPFYDFGMSMMISVPLPDWLLTLIE